MRVLPAPNANRQAPRQGRVCLREPAEPVEIAPGAAPLAEGLPELLRDEHRPSAESSNLEVSGITRGVPIETRQLSKSVSYPNAYPNQPSIRPWSAKFADV